MRRPWLKFWPADWRGDPKLRACSLIARAVWIELICLMHEGTPYGHCTLGGASLSLKELSALVGAPSNQVASGLAELERLGVFSRTDSGVIYSRRMVRDEEQRVDGQANGKRGGNPALGATDGKRGSAKGGDNPPRKGAQITHPSTPREPLASDSSSGPSGSSLPESEPPSSPPTGGASPKERRLWKGSSPPELAEAWTRWIAYRRERRKPVGQTEGDLALRELASWGPELAATAIDHAIARGWSGYRAPAGTGSSGPAGGPKPKLRAPSCTSCGATNASLVRRSGGDVCWPCRDRLEDEELAARRSSSRQESA